MIVVAEGNGHGFIRTIIRNGKTFMWAHEEPHPIGWKGETPTHALFMAAAELLDHTVNDVWPPLMVQIP